MKEVICRDKTIWLAENGEIIMMMRPEGDAYWIWEFTVPGDVQLEDIITDVADGKYDTSGTCEDGDLKLICRTIKNFFFDADGAEALLALDVYGYIENL